MQTSTNNVSGQAVRKNDYPVPFYQSHMQFIPPTGLSQHQFQMTQYPVYNYPITGAPIGPGYFAPHPVPLQGYPQGQAFIVPPVQQAPIGTGYGHGPMFTPIPTAQPFTPMPTVNTTVNYPVPQRQVVSPTLQPSNSASTHKAGDLGDDFLFADFASHQIASHAQMDDPFELKPIPPKDNLATASQAVPNISHRRCKRCNKYYSVQETTECRYHSGVYKGLYESKLGAGMFSVWTCCKQDARDARGCKTGDHLECEITTATLSQFDNLRSVQKDLTRDIPKPTPKPATEKLYPSLTGEEDYIDPTVDLSVDMEKFRMPKEEKKEEASVVLDPDTQLVEENNQQFIKHFVKMTDTLRGIALKYGVTPEELKTVNKVMKDDDVWGRNFLLVPYNGQQLTELDENEKERYRNEMRKRLVRRFVKVTRCSCDSEAVYYLQMNSFNFNDAVREYKEDVQWETKSKEEGVKFASVRA